MDGPQITVESFGFLHGIPEAPTGALLVDLRTALRNPADDERLIEMTGLDNAVMHHVLTTSGAMKVIARTVDQAKALYAANRRRNLMARILIGCQGGRHRSVVVASEVAHTLTGHGYRTEIQHHHIDQPIVRNS